MVGTLDYFGKGTKREPGREVERKVESEVERETRPRWD